MAFCTSCGSKLVDDALFCTECGAPVSSKDGAISDTSISLASSAAVADSTPIVTATESSSTMEYAPVGTTHASDAPSPSVSMSPGGSSKGINKFVVIGIVAVVIVIALVGVLAFILLTDSSNEENEVIQEDISSAESAVTMPDLAAMTEENAIAVLRALGLAWNVEYIDDPEQLVLEQFPESGTEISEGEEVTLTVGNGKSSATSQMGKARTVVLTVANPRNGQLVSADIRLDANDDVIPDLLTRQYTVDEIQAMGLSDAELYIARNSIVAKSGYIFHYQPNTQFFIDNCAWYNPSASEYHLQGIAGANAGVIRDVEASHGSWYLEIK